MNTAFRTAGILSVCAAMVWAILTTPGRIDRRIAAEAASTREVARQAIGSGMDRLDAQINGLRADVAIDVEHAQKTLTTNVAGLASVADTRLAAVQEDLNVHATIAEKLAIAELRVLNEHIGPVMDGAASIEKQIDDAAPLFLDCDHNADCLFNRYQGASKAFEKTMQAVAAAAPDTAKAGEDLTKQAAGIASDVHKVTARITAPQRWYRRVWNTVYGGMITAAGVF